MAFKIEFPIAQDFIQDGGNGFLVVADPFSFQSSAILYISSNNQPTIQVKISDIKSGEVFCRNPTTGAVVDLTAYKVANAAKATMGIQGISDPLVHVSLQDQNTTLEVTPAWSSNYDATIYMPVRLTNGTSFYNATGGGGTGGTVDQGAPTNEAGAWPIKITNGTTLAGVTSAGALKVDGSSITQPVSGLGPNSSILTASAAVIPTESIGNSTFIPLIGDGVFQGISEDVSTFVSIDVVVLSDQSSAEGGILIEFSQDNIIFNYSDTFTFTANIGAFYSLSPRAKYFRLTYTNGSVAQGSFQVSTTYYGTNRSIYVQNLDNDVQHERAVEVVRAVISAQLEGPTSNPYIALKATSSGQLLTSTETEYALPTVARLSSVPVSITGVSGDSVLVSGIVNPTIRVFKLFLVFAVTTIVSFKTGSTALDGGLPMMANGSIVLDLDSEPWFVTNPGEDLIISLGSSSSVGGRVYYTQS